MPSLSSFVSILALCTLCVAQNGTNCAHKTQFFDQKIDHQTQSNNATFKQQYQLIDDYFNPGGPILFYQGGETVDMLCMVRRKSLKIADLFLYILQEDLIIPHVGYI